MSQRQLPIILALGTTQTLAWASSYYLPALLADPMAHDLGVSSNWIFGAFSASLVISAMLGPRIGRQIDLVGGRQVLSVSSLTIAAGPAVLGGSQSVTGVGFSRVARGRRPRAARRLAISDGDGDCLARARHRHGDGTL